MTIVALAVGLTACGGSSHPSVTASSLSTSSTSVTPTTARSNTTTSTAQHGGDEFTLASSFTEADGYSFKVTARATIGQPGPGNSAQLAPGQNAVVLPVSGDATLTNVTAGRIAPGDPLSNATIMGLWKSPSPLCPDPPQGPTDATYMDVNSNVYCIVQLLTLQDANDNAIPAGGHSTLSAMPETCENQDDIPGGCGIVPTPTGDVALDYLTGHEPGALRALRTPPDLVVLIGPEGGSTVAAACSPSDTLGWIAASSTPITSCS